MTSETIWRVSAQVGFGWPLLTHREHKVRRFTREQDAARWCSALLALPSHHRLISIEVGAIDYTTTSYRDGEWVGTPLELPPVGCSRCGLVPAPPGPCGACGERARFIAPTEQE